MKCEKYPADDSCLLLGADTASIDSSIAKHIGVDQAVEHFQDMVGRGLIPVAGRVRMDDFFYGVPNRGKMLTICFCCTCCCTVLRSARFFPSEVGDSIVRLKGLSVHVDKGRCKACGMCVDDCPFRAIKIQDGAIIRDNDLCKGCGHCALVCVEDAVIMNIENVDEALTDMYERIGKRITVE